MNVAIIPARGGSKRIPRKNVKLFAGLPMIAHTIRAAQNAAPFARLGRALGPRPGIEAVELLRRCRLVRGARGLSMP